jgi:hypothetical protein
MNTIEMADVMAMFIDEVEVLDLTEQEIDEILDNDFYGNTISYLEV